jgi:phenylacetate-CoA ligase
MYSKFVRHFYFPLTQRIKGESITSYLKILKSNEQLSLPELQNIQIAKLWHILKVAYRNVTYYRTLFDGLGIHPEEIRSLQDFTHLPLLTKKTIAENDEQLLDPHYSGKIYPGKTSGSTGIPLKFYVTGEYNSWDWASRWRARNWFGIQIGDPEVAIWGRPLYSTIRKITDPLKGRIRNTMLVSGFEYSEEILDKFSRQIRRFNPCYFYGYSNSIYRLALYFKEQNLPIPARLKAIFVTAETLFPQERALVESVFGVPVSNEYGCSEIGGFAYECPAGNWHVSIENVFLELIENENGAREIVGTSLTNEYMPFIRYKIGDLGDWMVANCPCGCNLPIIKLRTGKATDIVIMSNGRSFSSEIFDYLNLALLELHRHPFDQYQIIQTSPAAFTIRYVKGRDFSESDLVLFRKIFTKTVQDDKLKLEFQSVPEIKPEPTGKMRYFISKIKKVEGENHAQTDCLEVSKCPDGNRLSGSRRSSIFIKNRYRH